MVISPEDPKVKLSLKKEKVEVQRWLAGSDHLR